MKVNVSFTIEVTDEYADRNDLLDWLRFELGATGSLSGTNLLNFLDLQSCTVKDVRIG
jgi:hypothetical protein